MRRPLRQEQQGVPAYERDLERAMESCDDLARLNDDDLCARLNQNVHFQARKLEFIITGFMFTMAGCFFGELTYLRPSAKEVVKGMFVPSLQGKAAATNAIALFGSIITPYKLFLHSALVLSRKTPRSIKSINAACRYFLIECGLAFIVAFKMNVALIAVAGTVCNAKKLSPADENTCSDLTLQSTPLLLRNVLGRSSSVVYAVALLASGQSTTISCTFSGQVIMQGFLDTKMKSWARNIITRVIAITPRLIASVVSGPTGAGKLIILSSMLLSFELPFSIIPLLKFSNSSKKIGPLKESVYLDDHHHQRLLHSVGLHGLAHPQPPPHVCQCHHLHRLPSAHGCLHYCHPIPDVKEGQSSHIHLCAGEGRSGRFRHNSGARCRRRPANTI